MRNDLAKWTKGAFLTLMFGGSALITAASLEYFDLDVLPPFVIEKLPVRFESLWLASLRLHVAAAALSFPLCLALMTRTLQRLPTWHRWLGRVAGALVLVALVPSGVVLAFDAKGGAPVTAGFLLSAAIVAACMVRGIVSARRRELTVHRHAMRHVVAQMSVAVTSRALIVALDAAGYDPELSYLVALWGPVLGSALVAEALTPSSSLSPSRLASSFQKVRHEAHRLDLLLRNRPVPRPFARLGR